MSWDWHFALQIFPQIFAALKVTLLGTLYGTVIALIAGVLLMLARRSSVAVVRGFARIYLYIFRGTPLLIQFYFAYYVFPLLGFKTVAFVAAVITLGLNFATYFAETCRSGIENVPRGQWEAAQALSFSTRRTWFSVIGPQAIRSALPALGNHVILMFKMSALMSVISVLDAFGTAINIGGTTYRYLEPVTIAGALYLLISIPTSYFIRHAERRQAESPIGKRA